MLYSSHSYLSNQLLLNFLFLLPAAEQVSCIRVSFWARSALQSIYSAERKWICGRGFLSVDPACVYANAAGTFRETIMADGVNKKLLNLKAVIIAGHALFNESSSESDDDSNVMGFQKKKVVPKVVGYAEITVPKFDDVQFKSHFRMNRTTFELLLTQLGFHLHKNDSRGNAGLEISKQLLICIWTLANQESFRYVLSQ